MAASLRRPSSGTVSGNITEDAIGGIGRHGLLCINCDSQIMLAVEGLLCDFVHLRRMKMVGEYQRWNQLLAKAVPSAVSTPLRGHR